jgi:hypothetical protein
LRLYPLFFRCSVNMDIKVKSLEQNAGMSFSCCNKQLKMIYLLKIPHLAFFQEV